MDFGEAIPIPLDTADGSKVGRDDLTPPPCKIGLISFLDSRSACQNSDLHR